MRPYLALLPLLVLSGSGGPDALAHRTATTATARPAVTGAALSPADLRRAVLLAPSLSPGTDGTLAVPPMRADLQAANGARRKGFYFSRAMYGTGSMGGFRRGRAWATDFPKADLQFLTVLHRLLPTLDMSDSEHPLQFTDPELRKYPYIYAVEVANMDLTEEEVHGLRDYLQAGGFLFVDDFWGTRQWDAFEYQLRRVLPGREIIDLPLDHPIFNTYYEIDKVVQVPVVGSACNGGPTYEQDGFVPAVRAILDDADRVMVLISWNSDLGDAWEWAEQSCYPLEYSTYAFQLAVNTIVYAMSR